MLFKNFVLNMPDTPDYTKDPRVIEFVKAVNLELRNMF
jgi:hypothetical protein